MRVQNVIALVLLLLSVTTVSAGDSALAAGADSESAARLANYAGGIVVMKRGTATVTRAELLRAVMEG